MSGSPLPVFHELSEQSLFLYSASGWFAGAALWKTRQFHAGGSDARQRRVGRHVDAEARVAEHLRDKANVHDPGVSPWQNRAVSLLCAKSFSSDSNVSLTQWRNQLVTSSSPAPNNVRKDVSTQIVDRVDIAGNHLRQHAHIWGALDHRFRQQRRQATSSRYSMIASDCDSMVPSSRINAGTSPCGLTARYGASRCSPWRRWWATYL